MSTHSAEDAFGSATDSFLREAERSRWPAEEVPAGLATERDDRGSGEAALQNERLQYWNSFESRSPRAERSRQQAGRERLGTVLR